MRGCTRLCKQDSVRVAKTEADRLTDRQRYAEEDDEEEENDDDNSSNNTKASTLLLMKTKVKCTNLIFLSPFEQSEEESDAKGDKQHEHRHQVIRPVESTDRDSHVVV